MLCLNFRIPIATTTIYIGNRKGLLDQSVKKELDTIISKNLKNQFEQILQNSTDWLSNDTISLNLKRLKHLQIYYSIMKNDEEISQASKEFEKIYESLDITDDIYENILNVNKLSLKYIFGIRNEFPSAYKFFSSKEMSNAILPKAYYFPNYIGNKIYLP